MRFPFPQGDPAWCAAINSLTKPSDFSLSGSWLEKGQLPGTPRLSHRPSDSRSSPNFTDNKVGVSPLPACEGDLGGLGLEPREGGHPKPARLVLQPLRPTDVWDCVCVKSAPCWACSVHPSPPVSFCCQEFVACNSLQC